jgi:ABC-type nitrate/sulfonate/bicarbonate transport system ATPase subunit
VGLQKEVLAIDASTGQTCFMITQGLDEAITLE